VTGAGRIGKQYGASGRERLADALSNCGRDKQFAMNTDGQQNGEPHSTMRSARRVNFYCHAPRAKSVQLSGDFNHWNRLPMKQRDDGWWFVQVLLAPGHHQYRFLVDGQPVLDPHAMGRARNQMNEEVSVVAAG
jgi:1,4-alpha-glucan branching enzyme